MLIKFSDNIFQQIRGVLFYNRKRLLAFVLISTFAVVQYKVCEQMGWWQFEMPVIPVSILGGALAIFLGFRNNHAYDRWWEARKIWGGIVNASRTFGMMVLSFSSLHFDREKSLDEKKINDWQREMIFRHLAWLHGLVLHLRKNRECESLRKYLSDEELQRLKATTNRPVQLINLQGHSLKEAYEMGLTDDFRHMELANLLKEFYALQGKCERIKNTVFPYYYNYFTRLFLWVFILALPFALVTETGWWVTIPMSIAISFVFSILEKSGTITEEPFEGRAADTPMSSIVRTIEIDLLEMLREENVPEPQKPKVGRFKVEYMD